MNKIVASNCGGAQGSVGDGPKSNDWADAEQIKYLILSDKIICLITKKC